MVQAVGVYPLAIRFYMKNIDKCLKIIENANSFTEQFKDPNLEKLISFLVLDKFFKKSNQNK